MTAEADTIADDEELIRGVGGIGENPSTQHCSGVEWNDKDILIEINDENITVHWAPAAALTPVCASNESEMLSPPESSGQKKLCIQELTAIQVLRPAPPLSLQPDYSNAELVEYTWPPLVSVIPWIKYEAQNMMEQT